MKQSRKLDQSYRKRTLVLEQPKPDFTIPVKQAAYKIIAPCKNWISINEGWKPRAIYSSRQKRWIGTMYKTKEAKDWQERWFTVFKRTDKVTSKQWTIYNPKQTFFLNIRYNFTKESFYFKNKNIRKIDVDNYHKFIIDSFFNYLEFVLAGIGSLQDQLVVKVITEKVITDQPNDWIYYGVFYRDPKEQQT